MRNLVELFRFLLSISREIRLSRAAIVLIVLAGIASGVLTTGMIALINGIMNRPAADSASVWGFVALCTLLPICRFLSQAALVSLTERSVGELRLKLIRRILSSPLRRLETIGPARLTAALTNDVATLVEALAITPILIMHLAIVASCLAYLGWLSWKVLFQISAFLVIGVITYQAPLLAAMRHFGRSRERFTEVVRQTRELAEGTKELKMHRGRRNGYLGAVTETVGDLHRANRAGATIFAAASSWGEALFFVTIGVVILLLPHFQPTERAVLSGYTLVLFQLMVPLEVLLSAFPSLTRATIAARSIEDLGLSLDHEPAEPERKEVPDELGQGRLELVGITHTYRREEADESFPLGPIDLHFVPGELVFFVGGNGSGKTTLAKLLVGLYAPESGEIRYEGRVVTEAERERYREHFAVVFSDPFIFGELYGLGAAALDDGARSFLAQLHLNGIVQVADGAFSSVELSQGQRKRLALFTAFLEDRPIYLFDEWAADQDPVFKRTFYFDLLPQLRARGKTVFVISHDDHYFHVADRVIKLDYGRVESDGPPPGRGTTPGPAL